MLTSDFDYHLPPELIAQHPLPRGQSRMLVLAAAGEARHQRVADLVTLLRPGDLLVANDTRVLPARLFGARRPGGGKVEMLLVEREQDAIWTALVKPGRRARPGTVIDLAPGLWAEVMARAAEDGRHLMRFSEPIEPHLQALGHVPLPPYIQRPDEEQDRQLYQTVFARSPGAIAAPTAGLHFSPELLASLAERGVEHATVTLHVGIGTFKPVTATLVHEHQMEEERWELAQSTAAAIERTQRRGGRVVAVGTTVVRTLESAALAAMEPGSTPEGGGQRSQGGDEIPRRLPASSGRTGLFITPGFRFRVVDMLLTNFHLPRSTLLMLVSAFAGREPVLAAYREAVQRSYRFYSYGDAMLLERSTEPSGEVCEPRS